MEVSSAAREPAGAGAVGSGASAEAADVARDCSERASAILRCVGCVALASVAATSWCRTRSGRRMDGQG